MTLILVQVNLSEKETKTMKNERYDTYSCSKCGLELIEDRDIEKLEYIRTTATADHYRCPNCDKEGFSIDTETSLDDFIPPAQDPDAPELSQEQIDFIKNLSHEMKTQDSRGTSQPYALVIQQDKIEYGIDKDYTDEFCIVWGDEVYHDNEYDDYVERVKQTIDDFKADGEKCDEWEDLYLSLLGNYDGMYSGTPILEDEMNIVGYKTYQTSDMINFFGGNLFLTEKSAEAYIDVNRHNLDNPKTYGVHLYRNPEMEKLYEIIHKLAEVLQ